jgi:methionyl-tRNA formyltransferase
MTNDQNQKRLVMCGCHQGGVTAVEALLRHGYRFEYFVCLTPEQGARYRVSGYFDYRPLAERYHIPVRHPESYSLDSQSDLGFFESQHFDLLIQGGWQRLFPAKILDTLSIGALGLHGSADLLPKGRGRSPMNWSLIEGRKRFLMHLFLIKPGIDDGDIICIRDFDITPFDDIETLYLKYGLVYRDMLMESLPSLLRGTPKVVPQVGIPSYYPKRTPADGRIDWETMDVWQIYNFVRAQTRPYPGAFAKVGDRWLRIWRCRVFDTRLRYDRAGYGECVERFGERLLINCRGGLLLIDESEILEGDPVAP